MFSHVEVVLFFTQPMNHDERYLDLASKNSFRHVRPMFSTSFIIYTCLIEEIKLFWRIGFGKYRENTLEILSVNWGRTFC